jgi:enoyl-CoA hydratase
MADRVQVSVENGIAVVRFDDGKANALGSGSIAELSAALDGAGRDAGAVVLVGRPERFSAGFDLKEMGAGPDTVRSVIGAGARLLMQIYTHPAPVVVGCSGHALAAGALVLLAADTRVGAAGAFKLGLNETQIGMSLPNFALELAEDRLSRRHLTAATIQARLYDPVEACDAGYLDEVVGAHAVESTAIERARALAELPSRAYAATKRALRHERAERVLAALDADLELLAGGARR